MCGRYASSRRPGDLVSYFEIDEAPTEMLAPSFNVAPTDPVYIVLSRQRDGGPPRRELQVARWGLVPSWAKDGKAAARHINARAESVATTPAYRSAYRRRRCLVPADGYYEWQQQGGNKQPYYLSALGGAPLAMAGLYELWRPADGTGAALWTCTVLTTSAPDEHAVIHDRTPLLVAREAWATWLDAASDQPDALLISGVPGVLSAWPVDKAVGNVRNNAPELVHPIDPGAHQPTLL